jgi:hypothetical protein
MIGLALFVKRVYPELCVRFVLHFEARWEMEFL